MEVPLKKPKIEIITASLPTFENAVEELWLDNSLIATIRNEPEDAEPVAAVYPLQSGDSWELPIDSLLSALQTMKDRAASVAKSADERPTEF
ncbi:MAG: hypothetical protein ABI972_01765 [Acidobacteriota bacterium]